MLPDLGRLPQSDIRSGWHEGIGLNRRPVGSPDGLVHRPKVTKENEGKEDASDSQKRRDKAAPSVWLAKINAARDQLEEMKIEDRATAKGAVEEENYPCRWAISPKACVFMLKVLVQVAVIADDYVQEGDIYRI